MITEGLEGSFDGSEVKINLEELEGSGGDPNENLFMNWPLMSSIIVYSVFSLHDMAYTEVMLLILVITYVPYQHSRYLFLWCYISFLCHKLIRLLLLSN